MSAPFTLSECESCGYLAYPPRILCPKCGASAWKRRLAEHGIVTETTVRRPVFKRRQLPWGGWLDQAETHLAAVQTDVGVRVVARIADDVQVGDRVTLEAHGSTAIALSGQVVEARAVQPGADGGGA